MLVNMFTPAEPEILFKQTLLKWLQRFIKYGFQNTRFFVFFLSKSLKLRTARTIQFVQFSPACGTNTLKECMERLFDFHVSISIFGIMKDESLLLHYNII